MKAAAQDGGRKLHFGRRDAAPVAGVATLRDVEGELVEPDVREQGRARVVQCHPLLAAVADGGDHRGQRHHPGRQAVHPQQRVHQRGLAAAEAADHDEVEAVLRKPAEHLSKAPRLRRLVRHRPQDFGQLELHSLIVAQVHDRSEGLVGFRRATRLQPEAGVRKRLLLFLGGCLIPVVDATR